MSFCWKCPNSRADKNVGAPPDPQQLANALRMPVGAENRLLGREQKGTENRLAILWSRKKLAQKATTLVAGRKPNEN